MKKLMALIVAIVSAFTVFTFAACSSASVTAVSLSGSANVYCGSEITLTADVTMSNNSTYSGEITWASSDESVATVTGGIVKGISAGTAYITATAGGVTSSAYKVIVAAVKPVSVTLSGEISVYCGNEITLTANVSMNDSSVYNGTISWTSSDESIATVTGGVVKGISVGTVSITATADGVSSSAYVVTVSERPSDKVDAAGWVAAMTSSDIYNSTATGTEIDYRTDSSGETTIIQFDITIEVDVVETNGNFAGKIYSLDVNGENSETRYFLYDESGITYYYFYDTEDGSENCSYSDSYYTVSGVLGMWYLQFMIADESYFGGDYFNYSENDGAYVWECISGSYTYRYIVKIIDGNVVYAGLFTYGDTYNETVEIYYTYGGVSVTIPEDIQSKFDALTVE